MHVNKNISNQLFETKHVTGFLVRIPPAHLNLLLQRKLYGLSFSVSGRRGDKNSRRFDASQVLGIALVWMLFQSGLRTEPIRQILKYIAETSEADAVWAALNLLSAEIKYLVVVRDTDDVESEFRVFVPSGDLTEVLASNPTASVLMLPVGRMFAEIETRMDVLQEVKRNVPVQTR